ncbi:MAG: DUF22 domain-containing protein [Candidatus Nezhaarchaeota archaeon]|nr:DUF22 domain-containing protein [Candidatus Nezhaarchaeota archaeon]
MVVVIHGINLVYEEVEGPPTLKRVKVEEEIYEYVISTRARWEPIIAIEKVAIKANSVHQVAIRPVRLNPNELMIPCPASWNCLGHVVNVGRKGIPQKVEKARTFDYANFLAFKDGAIVEGDLLGVLNVFPKATIMAIFRGSSGAREVYPPYRG